MPTSSPPPAEPPPADTSHHGSRPLPGRLLAHLGEIREGLESLYKDLHAHPELSFAEKRTACRVARELDRLGFRVLTGVGRTGVVGILENGTGHTALLRADFDALPVRERTGLPYASAATGTGQDGKEVPVMHACGHDMHVACLLGACALLAGDRDVWSGTVVAVFQPAEEVGGGARAMVDDGLFDEAGTPDVVLGQHVVPLPAGMIACHPGATLAATDALHVRMHGRGGHGSQPEATVDPVVMAASAVVRLQSVVSREVPPAEPAVVTVGSLHAGTKDNVIPSEAELRINIRTYTDEVRTTVLDAVKRIVRAEAEAAGAEREPDIEATHSFPVLVNDETATARTVRALRDHFGDDLVVDPGPLSASEDCGVFGTASGAPVCYWFVGSSDPELHRAAARDGTAPRDIPTNHSPFFAPLVQPTLDTGVQAMTAAALAWLGGDGGPGAGSAHD